MFEAAIVAWLIALIGDRGVKGLTRVILGTPQQRALRDAIEIAVQPVMASVPQISHSGLSGALTEQFSRPPMVLLDGETPVRAGMVAAIRAQLAPLATSHYATGKSFLEQWDIDAALFVDQFTGAVLMSITQVAANDSALSPLAAQLNADASHEAESAILRQTDRIVDLVEQLLRDPTPTRSLAPRRTAPLTAPPPDPLPAEAVDSFVDSMLAVPAVRNDNSRSVINDMLEAEMDGGITQQSSPRLQVVTWFQECPNRRGGLTRLVQLIRLVEGNSAAMQRLDQAIMQVGEVILMPADSDGP